MITRRIGAFLRGKATPFSVVTGALGGAWLGFAPGALEAPGWIAALVLALLVVNANLALAGLALCAGRIASWILAPVSFEVGRLLLDGPTSELFRAFINAPVLAFFGFDRYLTAGGLVVGGAFGALLGLASASALTAFRKRLASLDEGSPQWVAFCGRRWVRVARFLLVGGAKGQRTWAELAQRRLGNPVRIPGLVAAVLLVGAGFAFAERLAIPLVTQRVRSGLERANGATVELDAVTLDLAAGRLVLEGLALVDPQALDRDLLRARRLEADVDVAGLLRGRLGLERIVVRDAHSGALRATPGERIARAAGARPTSGAEPGPGSGSDDEPLLDERSLDELLRDAEHWKVRLAGLRGWTERFAKTDDPRAGDRERGVETLRERAERLARSSGRAVARAEHLVEETPAFWIGELRIEGLAASWLPGEVLDLHAANLSTHPWLVAGSPRIELAARSGRFELALGLDATAADPSANRIAFVYRELSVDALLAGLELIDRPPFAGGTVTFALDGEFGAGGGAFGSLDLPLDLTLRGTTLRMPGASPLPLDELTLTFGVRGALDSPRFTFDEQGLAQRLVAAGAGRLVVALGARAQREVSAWEARASDELVEAAGKLGAQAELELRDHAVEELGERVGVEPKALFGRFFGGRE